MPKSKASDVVQIGHQNLVDAEAIGALIGFTPQYVNRLAAAGKIPWHGVRNGAKVYRRYDPLQVLHELKHDVEASGSAESSKPVAQTGRNKYLRAKQNLISAAIELPPPRSSV